jgi:hypothetical protein
MNFGITLNYRQKVEKCLEFKKLVIFEVEGKNIETPIQNLQKTV